MAYSTKTDIETAFGAALVVSLTDDSSTGAADAARVARAIADADAVIDGHLRAHYSVPLVTTPDLVRKLSCDLALHALYCRRASGLELPTYVRDLHKAAMEMLKAMREGSLDLGVEPPPAASSAEVAEYSSTDRPALFTDDSMDGF